MNRSKIIVLWIVLICNSNYIFAQDFMFGGEYQFKKSECISTSQRDHINTRIVRNIQTHKLNYSNNKMLVKYDWPIQQNPAFDYNSTYAISNFVDHNSSSVILDYNCGDQSYDGHRGTDIYLWPFDHLQVANEQTWAVAGADGTILDKNDGEDDDSCVWDGGTSNYVILGHSDGSHSWYLHLKKNSLTSRGIGETISSGEYLGVIASSGNSTGPHLHFECYDSRGLLIDPYQGPCNDLNIISYWNDQKPYWEPTINTLLTHSAEPIFSDCPNEEITNIKTVFEPGDLVFFTGYFHDQRATSSTTYEIRYPDGSIWMSWNHQPTQDYRSSWWYWDYYLPNNAPEGQYTFQATLDGETVIRTFEVKTCPPFLDLFSSVVGDIDYETDGAIEALQFLQVGVHVTYDSGTGITFENEYEIKQTASLEAIIDGCGCIDLSKKNQNPICVLIYAPVCGCDGNTYSNFCVAENAGVVLYQPGPCE